MASNAIRDVTFRPVAAASGDAHGDGHALFLTIELADPARLAGLVDEAVARFTRERIAGPRDARFMLITVLGEITAGDFAHAWRAAIAHDAPARALLGMMQQADVMQGDIEGRMIGTASLLGAPPTDDA